MSFLTAKGADIFTVTARDASTRARAGVLRTRHGAVQTPVFMPVGTLATVKAVSSEELEELGAQIILSNTYHLYLRPGSDLIRASGELHGFMAWNRPILTDSGGYQIFSMQDVKTISPEGLAFKSHHDGSSHFLSPEDVISVQDDLGSDIWMPLDHCVGIPASRSEVRASVDQTTEWARRSKKAWLEKGGEDRSLLFGIIQGGVMREERQRSARGITDLDFPGYALGGLSVGESQEEMLETLQFTVPMMSERPRYLMGVGYPDDLVLAVEQGMDMFDCVVPTRNGRNGTVFTRDGRLLLGNQEFARDGRPIEEDCRCPACLRYSRAYLRHLFKAKEILGLRLASLHNLYFFIKLLDDLRTAIRAGAFGDFKRNFFNRYPGKGL